MKKRCFMYPFQNPQQSADERIRDLLSRLTLEEKIGFLSTHHSPVERLGIGEWHIGQEVARGLVNREPEKPVTVFPQPIGMAASFDKDMMYEIGKTAARESRAYYNQNRTSGLMVWGPTVDLNRDPRWGRLEECYGEDPCLTGEMAAAYTLGLRGEGRIYMTIPTLKHFCANNHEENRGIDNANLSPRLKHEYYYAAFRTPIRWGGARSIMTAYNSICHTPAVMNHDLNTVLKAQWGLKFVVTDGADFSQNVTMHKCVTSHAEALQACLIAGADCMTDADEAVHAAAKKALAEGLITEEMLDAAIGNTLMGRLELGHFDADDPYSHLTLADVNTDADRALNLRAAKENMILLENQGVLPLDADSCGTIGLFGVNHNCNLMDWYTGYSEYQISVQKGLENRGCRLVTDPGWDIITIEAPNGCYLRIDENGTLTADGTAETAARLYFCRHDAQDKWVNLCDTETGRIVTIRSDIPELGTTTVYGWFTGETLHFDTHSRTGKQVISDYLHGKQLCLDAEGVLRFRQKARPDSSVMFIIHTVSDGTQRLVQLAKQCDTVIYCAGNDPEQVARECYDRRTIALPPVQQKAVETLAETCRNFVLLLVSSYPYALHFPTRRPGAILYTTHAGPELGTAVAATLFGENNPAGRCPVTWYACDEDLADIRDYDIMKTKMTYLWFDGTPLYPFGHGISYSSFSYSGLQVKAEPDGVVVQADITNTSGVDGDEVVQLYFCMEQSTLPRPQKKLCGFERLHIPAGETVHFTQRIPYRGFEIYDVSREKLCLETGTYIIFAGASSQDIRLQEAVQIEGETIPPRTLKSGVRAELYDIETGTEIFTDHMTGETHIRGMQWTNMICFRNVNLTGVSELILRAAAPVTPMDVTVCLDWGGAAAVVHLPACDGYTDFHECRCEFHAEGCHDIILWFGEGLCIQTVTAK